MFDGKPRRQVRADAVVLSQARRAVVDVAAQGDAVDV